MKVKIHLNDKEYTLIDTEEPCEGKSYEERVLELLKPSKTIIVLTDKYGNAEIFQ